MTKPSVKRKRPNPPDATGRNVRAAKTRTDRLERALRALTKRVATLERWHGTPPSGS